MLTEKMPFQEYMKNLWSSKISLSPFGMGEFCFRDLESMMMGTVVLKPSHKKVDTLPNLMVDNETFIPCKYDWSDLEEKIDYILSNFNEIKESWISAQDKINLDNQIKILKTHQGKYTVGKNSFTNDQNTLATIYIVRDPRTLISSISNHYTLPIDGVCDFLTTPQIIGNTKKWEDKETGMQCLLGKWNDHYRSWTRNKNNFY